MTMTLLGISGSLTKGGSTRTAIDCALRAAQQRLAGLQHNLAPRAIDQSCRFHQSIQRNRDSSSIEFSHLNG